MSSGRGHRAGKSLPESRVVITFKNFSARISHDAHTAKIVIFYHPFRREPRALEIHSRGRPGERAGKETSSAKRTSALLHPFRGGLYAVFRVFRAARRTKRSSRPSRGRAVKQGYEKRRLDCSGRRLTMFSDMIICTVRTRCPLHIFQQASRSSLLQRC